ncbi:MAG: 16S rRNA (guanine(966)-N(2))-methyltransferase RsmD [Dehalococcoidia bacterium]
MRVTGGSARGRRLKTPGQGVRPTADRVREAIFNTLEAQGVSLDRVLDVYAGSGALGIEALSRGAGHCDFVERNEASAAIIRENLAMTGLEERARVHRMKAEQAAGRLSGPYTLILADPPYEDGQAQEALASIAEAVGVASTLVFEHSSRREAPGAIGPLGLAWSRKYGDTQLSIYRGEASS